MAIRSPRRLMMPEPGISPVADYGELRNPIPIHGCNCSDIDHNLAIVTQLLQLNGFVRPAAKNTTRGANLKA
jgi:hypothetical protein